jgi:hypothetical protein
MNYVFGSYLGKMPNENQFMFGISLQKKRQSKKPEFCSSDLIFPLSFGFGVGV